MVAVISKLVYCQHLGIQEKGSCDSLEKELNKLMLLIIQLCYKDNSIYLFIPMTKSVCCYHKKL